MTARAPRGGDTRPTLSVLVLAYNHESYLAMTLDSILAQDFDEPFEVLVGEDHSPDGTLAVAERYARENRGVVRVITSSQNVGMHANHRRLMRASRGDFVAFCEGDDFWSAADKARLQVEYLRQHPEHSGVHSDVDHLIEVSGKQFRMPRYWSTHRPDLGPMTTFDDLLVENVVQTCSLVLRGEVARAFPDSPMATHLYQVDDWPLSLHATMTAPLGRLPQSLATYRRVEGSATNQGHLAAERRIYDQLRLLDDAASIHPHDEKHPAAGRRRTRWALLVLALRAGDRRMAARWATLGPHDLDRATGRKDPRLEVVRVLSMVPGVVQVAGVALRARERHLERRRYLELTSEQRPGSASH